MSAELVRLTNAGPMLGTEPEPGIVKILERLLVSAQAGEIKAFAYALVDGADTTATHWDAGCAALSDFVSSVAILHHRVLTAAVA